jgi:hypothetical protein
MPVDEEIIQIIKEMKAGYIARHRKLLAAVGGVDEVGAEERVKV